MTPRKLYDKLSPAQERALAKLSDKWQSAYTLQESMNTLDALVRRGLAARNYGGVGSLFSPRTAIHYRRIKS